MNHYGILTLILLFVLWSGLVKTWDINLSWRSWATCFLYFAPCSCNFFCLSFIKEAASMWLWFYLWIIRICYPSLVFWSRYLHIVPFYDSLYCKFIKGQLALFFNTKSRPSWLWSNWYNWVYSQLIFHFSKAIYPCFHMLIACFIFFNKTSNINTVKGSSLVMNVTSFPSWQITIPKVGLVDLYSTDTFLIPTMFFALLLLSLAKGGSCQEPWFSCDAACCQILW